jgi:TfoX/Sxy family transcriptional regulator of competence genes
MAWIKVPPANHPLFHAALPKDPRVTTMPLFGGVAAKVNGHIFAGLFARSVMLWLDDAGRAEALALDGAGPFDPMGDGRARSAKIMLPEDVMDEPAELRRWIARAFEAVKALPPKAQGKAKAKPKPAGKAKPAVKAQPAPKPKSKLATKKSKSR